MYKKRFVPFLKRRSLGLVFVFPFLKKFIYFGLCGILIAVRELSLVAVRGPLSVVASLFPERGL